MGKDAERGKYTSPEGSRTWEYLSTVFCAIGSFCIGNMLGWNSPSINEFLHPNSTITVTPEDVSSMTACMSIGHLLAFPLSVYVVEKVGRRNCILLSSIPMMMSWGMIALAKSVEVLILARIITGLSMGIVMSSSPILMAEILSADIRGSLAGAAGVTAFCGVFFMFGVTPQIGVQRTALFCMGFTVLFLISFWFIPESPYWLAKVGRVEDAEKSLEKLRGKTDVSEELELIKATIREKGKSLIKSEQIAQENDTKSQNAFKQLFTIRGNVKALSIGLVLATIQHFCGFQTILYYCHAIIQDMGSGFDIYTATMIFSVIQMVSAGMSAVVIDRFGRRPLLLGSGLLTSVFLIIIASYFCLIEHIDVEFRKYSAIPLGSIFILVVVLNLGIMTVPGMLLSEIYGADVKLLANCIVMVSGSFMTIAITKSYFLMAKSWGLGHSVPFAAFALITIICTILLARWVPETRGKTLLEIQKELNA